MQEPNPPKLEISREPVVEAYDISDPFLQDVIAQGRDLGCDFSWSTLEYWQNRLGSNVGIVTGPHGHEYTLDLEPFSARDPRQTIILIRFSVPNDDLRHLPRSER